MNTPPQRGPEWSRDVFPLVPRRSTSSEVTPNLFEAFFQFALYTDQRLQSRIKLIIIHWVNLVGTIRAGAAEGGAKRWKRRLTSIALSASQACSR